jgi:hypothetical protein
MRQVTSSALAAQLTGTPPNHLGEGAEQITVPGFVAGPQLLRMPLHTDHPPVVGGPSAFDDPSGARATVASDATCRRTVMHQFTMGRSVPSARAGASPE